MGACALAEMLVAQNADLKASLVAVDAVIVDSRRITNEQTQSYIDLQKSPQVLRDNAQDVHATNVRVRRANGEFVSVSFQQALVIQEARRQHVQLRRRRVWRHPEARVLWRAPDELQDWRGSATEGVGRRGRFLDLDRHVAHAPGPEDDQSGGAGQGRPGQRPGRFEDGYKGQGKVHLQHQEGHVAGIGVCRSLAVPLQPALDDGSSGQCRIAGRLRQT